MTSRYSGGDSFFNMSPGENTFAFWVKKEEDSLFMQDVNEW